MKLDKLENIQPIQEFIEKIVIPPHRSEINIIPEHRTMLRGQKSKKQLINKKKNNENHEKSKTLTRKEARKLGLYHLPTKSIQYQQAEQLNALWLGYMIEHLSITADFQIPEVYDKRYDTFSKLIMKCDLHGAKIVVSKSKCPNYVGLNGIVVLDTKNILNIVSIDNKLRKIPKQECIFEIELYQYMITVFGKHINIRPAERSVKKMKCFIEPDL